METAGTKTVEQMSESFIPQTMEENFSSWASRVASDAKKEEKKEEGKHGPREISLKGRDDNEREWIEKVGEKVESESKESQGKSAAEKDGKRAETEKPDAKTEKLAASESSSEPLASAERYWQTRDQGKAAKITQEEAVAHVQDVNNRLGAAVEYIKEHPQREQIEKGLGTIFGANPNTAWKNAVLPDLFTCLAEIPNAGEVLRHFGLVKEDREVLLKATNWKELRAAIQTVSKAYPAAKSQPAPKARAPRPPTALPGRSTGDDSDSTRGMDFRDFSRKMDQKYSRHAR